jgi:hypothetical protein
VIEGLPVSTYNRRAEAERNQLRTVVESSERWDVTRDAAMQKRVKSPPKYPICSEITHTIAATIADDMAEPLSTATAAIIAQPSMRLETAPGP